MNKQKGNFFFFPGSRQQGLWGWALDLSRGLIHFFVLPVANCLPPATSLPNKMPQKYPWASSPGMVTAQDLWVSLMLPFNCGLWTYSLFVGALFFSVPFHETLPGLALWNKDFVQKISEPAGLFFASLCVDSGWWLMQACTLEFSPALASYSIRLAGTGGVVWSDPLPRLFATTDMMFTVCPGRHFLIPLLFNLQSLWGG